MTALLKVLTFSLTFTLGIYYSNVNPKMELENTSESGYCASDHIHETLWNQHPDRKIAHDNFEKKLYDFLNNQQGESNPPPYTLPA